MVSRRSAILLWVSCFVLFLEPTEQGFTLKGPKSLGEEEKVCLRFKGDGEEAKSQKHVILSLVAYNDKEHLLAETQADIKGGFQCVLFKTNISRTSSKIGRFTLQVVYSDGRVIKKEWDVLLRSVDSQEGSTKSKEILISSYVNKNYSNKVHDKNVRRKRDSAAISSNPGLNGTSVSGQADSQRSGRSGLFSQFSDLDIDLDVPNQISGQFQVYAMPPPKPGANHKCPHCSDKAPELFTKLYCSSELAFRVRFRGRHVMEVMQDVSKSAGVGRKLRRSVSYTIKHRCSCDIATDNSEAFILVTPPRNFNLRSVQVIHLDDSISIFPWSAVDAYLKTSINCADILTS